jgi:FAD binding domain
MPWSRSICKPGGSSWAATPRTCSPRPVDSATTPPCEDAVNLGWKLAATLRGCGGPGLLASYEPERRPVAVGNTTLARTFAESLGSRQAEPELETDTPAGARPRSGR